LDELLCFDMFTLQINGNNLVGVSHEEAVQCFTKARETVILKVLHGAQDNILVWYLQYDSGHENYQNCFSSCKSLGVVKARKMLHMF